MPQPIILLADIGVHSIGNHLHP